MQFPLHAPCVGSLLLQSTFLLELPDLRKASTAKLALPFPPNHRRHYNKSRSSSIPSIYDHLRYSRNSFALAWRFPSVTLLVHGSRCDSLLFETYWTKGGFLFAPPAGAGLPGEGGEEEVGPFL